MVGRMECELRNQLLVFIIRLVVRMERTTWTSKWIKVNRRMIKIRVEYHLPHPAATVRLNSIYIISNIMLLKRPPSSSPYIQQSLNKRRFSLPLPSNPAWFTFEIIITKLSLSFVNFPPHPLQCLLPVPVCHTFHTLSYVSSSTSAYRSNKFAKLHRHKHPELMRLLLLCIEQGLLRGIEDPTK